MKSLFESTANVTSFSAKQLQWPTGKSKYFSDHANAQQERLR